MIPETFIYNKLVTLFPTSATGPGGTTVYHAVPGTEPIDPYVLYRRTNTQIERDLQNTPILQTIEIEVSIASMFFDKTTTIAMPDNWTYAGWYFALESQQQDVDQFTETFTYSAVKAV